jgi:hypothetical protein
MSNQKFQHRDFVYKTSSDTADTSAYAVGVGVEDWRGTGEETVEVSVVLGKEALYFSSRSDKNFDDLSALVDALVSTLETARATVKSLEKPPF